MIDIAKLGELAERATRGPFEARSGRGEVLSRDAEATARMREMHFAHSNAWDSLEQREKDFQDWYDGAFLFAESMTSANAEYVAELANRAPELLAELKTLRAENEKLRGDRATAVAESLADVGAGVARLRRLADAGIAVEDAVDIVNECLACQDGDACPRHVEMKEDAMDAWDAAIAAERAARTKEGGNG